MSQNVVVREADRPGDLGWMVMANAEVYAEQFAWDRDYETLVARIVADAAASDSSGTTGWIAELGASRVGCVLCVDGDAPDEARLRILLVTPDGRGRGAGRALVDACLDFAESIGRRRVVLWTNSVLGSARRIYEAVGFELVEEEAHTSFGHDLVGQNWRLDLDRRIRT